MCARLQRWPAADDRALLRQAGELSVDLGMRLFLAGGSVRDAILGREHDDWDIVVEGDGPAYAQALGDALGGRVVVHQRFLTATVEAPDGRSLDVATARRETYPEPGALPIVQPATIEEDLWRRDFSINALAAALAPAELGRLIDPTGGAEDIDAGIVRVLHERSFQDDATRAVRAVGFEQRLGFTLEPQTETWLREAVCDGALETVAGERLAEALLPLLSNAVGPSVLARLNELGMSSVIGARSDLSARALGALREAPDGLVALERTDDCASQVVACLAAILAARDVDAERVIAHLHLDRPAAKELRAAQRALDSWPTGFAPRHTPGDLWQQLDGTAFGGIIALWLTAPDAEARRSLEVYWRELRGARADVHADELEALGHRPGPLFGRALDAATRAKLNGEDHDRQLAAAREALKSENEPGQ